MKILILQFPLESAWGGAESHTLTLARGLKKFGHEIFLLSGNQFLLAAFQKENFRTKKVTLGWEPTTIFSLLLFPLTIIYSVPKLIFYFLKLRPQIIICLSLTDRLVATPLAWIISAKVIWIEHTRVGRWLLASPLRPWYILAGRLAKIVAPSYFLRNQLIKVGLPVDKVKVIYPGVDVTTAVATRPTRPSTTLGFLGRLTEEKGVDFAIQAIRNLPSDFNLIIGGTGPEENTLRQLVKNLQLDDRVKFLGNIEEKEFFFQKIDILIMPSILAEAFGLVVIEALAAGVPVAASRIGAIPEIIEHKVNGWLFAPGDEESLAAAVTNLLQNSERIKKTALQAAASRFSSEQMVEEFNNLISTSNSKSKNSKL